MMLSRSPFFNDIWCKTNDITTTSMLGEDEPVLSKQREPGSLQKYSICKSFNSWSESTTRLRTNWRHCGLISMQINVPLVALMNVSAKMGVNAPVPHPRSNTVKLVSFDAHWTDCLISSNIFSRSAYTL